MVLRNYKKQKEIKITKSDVNEILKGGKESEEQKSAIKISKYFTDHNKRLIHCLMIIPKLYLKLNIKQNMEKRSKY